jgi:hypothetical protein
VRRGWFTFGHEEGGVAVGISCCVEEDIAIRVVDVVGRQNRGLEPSEAYMSGCAEPFYGTMAGP